MSLLGESSSDPVAEDPEAAGELTQSSVPGGWRGLLTSVRWTLGAIEWLAMETERVQIILSEPPPPPKGVCRGFDQRIVPAPMG